MAEPENAATSGRGGACVNELRVIALPSVAMVHEGDDLVAMFLEALGESGLTLEDRDLVIVTSKVVSKSEGPGRSLRRHRRDTRSPSSKVSPRRVLRRRGPMRITETRHGFINANAGIDLSNTDDGTAVLLPKDPDRSARRFRAEIRIAATSTSRSSSPIRSAECGASASPTSRSVSAGVKPVLDLRGTMDATGRVLEVTEVAIADEIAGAANLVLAKAAATPFALLRGLDESFFGEGSIKDDALRRANEDLFR